MTINVKICGLKTPEAVATAIAGGASYVGFVFFEPSPRNITPDQAALLTADIPDSVTRVGLTVNASDALLEEIASKAGVDLLQLHGNETPDRVRYIKALTGLPVMKMIPVETVADLDLAHEYEAVADYLIFDARAPKGATRPGGNAVTFDWAIMKDKQWKLPWMLAGGLTIDNVAEAVRVSGASIIDLSSAVESAPGVKSPEKIKAFLKAVSAL